MRRTTQSFIIAGTLVALGTASFPPTAVAQLAQPAVSRTATRPAEEVLAQLGKNAGVVVLADATIFARLPMVKGAATPEGVEQQLAEMVQTLPPGTTWIKVYAPVPANDRWSADAVADYARAQARLLGKSSRPAPPGMVEIFGHTVPADQAQVHLDALNLKLVYLVTNPRPAAAAAAGSPLMPAAEWQRLGPEMQDRYVQQQAQQLMRLDPSTRAQVVRQMMRREPTPQDMIMKTMLSGMTDDERIQFRQSLSQAEQKEKFAADAVKR